MSKRQILLLVTVAYFVAGVLLCLVDIKVLVGVVLFTSAMNAENKYLK